MTERKREPYGIDSIHREEEKEIVSCRVRERERETKVSKREGKW